MIAGIVPNLGQYLEPSGGLNIGDAIILKEIDELRNCASTGERSWLDERLDVSIELYSSLFGRDLWRGRRAGDGAGGVVEGVDCGGDDWDSEEGPACCAGTP